MSFIREVTEETLPMWESSLSLPFVKGLADGTLDEELFKGYIIQDSIYLREYAKVFAMAIFKSERMTQIKEFYQLLGFIKDTENVTRVRYLQKWGLDENQVDQMKPRKENLDYTEFMIEVSKKEGVPEILMATLPCMFSYVYIGLELIKRYPNIKKSPYWDMIEEYVSPFCIESCNHWGAFSETLLAPLDGERKTKLKGIFQEASQHEYLFWKMAGEKE